MIMHFGCEDHSSGSSSSQSTEMNAGESSPDQPSDMNSEESLLDVGMTEVDQGETDGSMSPGGAESNSELQVPMVPQTQLSELVILSPNQLRIDDNDVTTYLYDSALKMAVYAGYPTRFELDVSFIILEGCGQGTGSLEIQSVNGENVSAEIINLTSLAIEDWPEGESSVTVDAIYRPGDEDLMRCEEFFSEGQESKVELRYQINAYIPAQIMRNDWPSGCRDTLEDVLLVEGYTQPIQLRLATASGETFTPMNATPRRIVNLNVSGPEGLKSVYPESGISGLQLGPNPGTLSLTAPFGDPINFAIHDIQEVTTWSLAWSIAGVAGGGISELEEGETYDGPWNRTSNRLVPVVTGPFMRDGQPFCVITPSPAWFTLSSDTPEVCRVDTDPYSLSEVGGTPLGHSLSLIADGTCQATLSAPRFNGGLGMNKSITVTINDVDTMVDL